jgi:hypothetical protein
MGIGLGPVIRELERFLRVPSPEEDTMSNQATDLQDKIQDEGTLE